MLIEIHILQNHAPSNLNRDDTGSPKECTFGGVRRARISSQCLKRSIRRSEIFRQALDGKLGIRTRRLPEIVREKLTEKGLSEEMAKVGALKASGFGTKDGKERKPKNEDDPIDTAQTMFLTQADINAVVDVIYAAAKEAETTAKFDKNYAAKDLQAKAQTNGYRPITVDVALFGRMTTSEAFRDVEASTQVAHAISTHKVDHEYDYFTAVDDLQGLSEEEEDAGADMIGEVEYNASCYYKYFSIDTRALCRNLSGEANGRKDVSQTDKDEAEKTARDTVEAFLKAAIMTTPSGKQNSFAAHQLPSMVLVEARPQHTPVSYANAFVKPAWAGKGDDLVQSSLTQLQQHVAALTNGFNLKADARLMLAPEHSDFVIPGVDRVADLDSLCAAIKGKVRYD
jgi:CRISPR system Cascade subunit CasC